MYVVGKKKRLIIARLAEIAKKLREMAQKSDEDIFKIHYTELALMIGISTSYAAQLAKQLPQLFEDIHYERGYIIVEKGVKKE